MFKNYIRVAFRNLFLNKVHSFINVLGLSAGMAIALLIGLWVWDELSWNHCHPNYERIAQVKQNQTINKEIQTWISEPFPMGEVLRQSYGNDFKYVCMSSWMAGHILSIGDKQYKKTGEFFEPSAPRMLGLQMLQGNMDGLQDPHSILLSASTARTFFGNADPMDKLIKIDNKLEAIVRGVYADLPANSSFAEASFLGSWELYTHSEQWILHMENPWGLNGFQVFVQLADHADMAQVSGKIRNVKLDHLPVSDRTYKPQLFLHPMSRWHLHSDFRDGREAGGRIQYVWLFGIIGVFVLLLACINFMNLSTARSEKRAKEVGIRKAIGSLRGQLIAQFFCESFLIVLLAFGFALLLAELSLPFFNSVADKQMVIPWNSPVFWIAGICFSLFTGLVAGSYPALYLSAFRPVQVLKGTFRAPRLASLPRQALVVLQFTVSVVLIIGTIVVYRQINYAKNRPVGYDRSGLISVPFYVREQITDHVNALQKDLEQSGAISSMSFTQSPLTSVWSTNGGFDWQGKPPGLSLDLPNTGVGYNYGKTVGWQFREGRDFSKDYTTDTTAFVMNEAAAHLMGLTHPVGMVIRWDDHPYTIIGIIKDVVVESPYEPVRPSLYYISRNQPFFAILRIQPSLPTREALQRIEPIFRSYFPGQPFEYQFADEAYAKKFGNEERIGKLATGFAVLAIFISCLGLFGMASFMAEQRVKEIGVRRVLGASVFSIWQLLSRHFVGLILLSLLIAVPLSWFLMSRWLLNYSYHPPISWWIFLVAGTGALLITLLTVSFQAIRAALTNPVQSLRPE